MEDDDRERSDTPRHPVRGEGREALVDAAIELIVSEGTRGVTYRSVAARAGVTHGLVRHHFTSLRELVRAAVDEWARQSIDVTDLEPGTGRIDDIADELPANLREHAFEHVAMYELVMDAVRTGDLRDEMQQTYRRFTAATSRELRRANIADENGVLGQLVFAAIDGLVIQQLLLGDDGRLDAGLQLMRSLVRHYAHDEPA